jgi:SAM-dependent methyltransferase
MRLTDRLRHIRERRRVLSKQIDAFAHFEEWEETCVPSYIHPNRAAAGVAWWRLFAAADLASKHVKWDRVLDFGASVGELGLLLPPSASYEFIEMEEPAAEALLRTHPNAVRHTLEDAPDGAFSCVFALDALEHNTNYAELLELLSRKLAPDGVFVMSGPTESSLYKLGRKIARFGDHYHETDIYAIEEAAAKVMTRVDVTTLPPVASLFRISAWRNQA